MLIPFDRTTFDAYLSFSNIVYLFQLNWQKIKHVVPCCIRTCCGTCCSVENMFSDEELHAFDDLEENTTTTPVANPAVAAAAVAAATAATAAKKKKEEEEETTKMEDEENHSPPPSSDTRCCVLATRMFLYPFVLLFSWTIPENQNKNRSTLRWFGSFVCSLLWLFLLVFLMIEWASKVGCLINISETVMGLTVTAIGT